MAQGGTTHTDRIFDFDNHYYESIDAFTRHQDPGLRGRGIRWAEIDGRRRLLVGGTVNSYVANPTFDPVSKPGALYDWYRGNPRREQITDAFGELEPLRPEYQDREPRLRVMDQQGLSRRRALPHARCRDGRRAQARPGCVLEGVPRLQSLAGRGLGLRLRGAAVRCALSPPLGRRGRAGRVAPGARRRCRRRQRAQRTGPGARRLPLSLRPGV